MYENYFKRLLDILGASVLLIITTIPMLIIALIIKIVSPGPILFKQKRYGKDSIPFILLKFRTMNVETPLVANQNFKDIDDYVYTFGLFLRKTSLDELPQLFNVLIGQMSFIGPRPLADSDITAVNMRKKTGADKVTPGISGLAQVNGRNSITDKEKVMYDTVYATDVTFRRDVLILLDTFGKVAGQKNINRGEKS